MHKNIAAPAGIRGHKAHARTLHGQASAQALRMSAAGQSPRLFAAAVRERRTAPPVRPPAAAFFFAAPLVLMPAPQFAPRILLTSTHIPFLARAVFYAPAAMRFSPKISRPDLSCAASPFPVSPQSGLRRDGGPGEGNLKGIMPLWFPSPSALANPPTFPAASLPRRGRLWTRERPAPLPAPTGGRRPYRPV